jgi:hypothetical protein
LGVGNAGGEVIATVGAGKGALKENPPGLNSVAAAFSLDATPALFEEGKRECDMLEALAATPLKVKPEPLPARTPKTKGFALGLRFGFGN